jgi:hypothetical protein
MQRAIPGMCSLDNNRFAQMFASGTTTEAVVANLLSLSSSNLMTLAVLDYSKRES